MKKYVLSLVLLAVPVARSNPLKLNVDLKRKLHKALKPGRHLQTGNAADDENGEEACENKGFNEDECYDVGCCEWDEDQCWSSVGTGECSHDHDDDCDDNMNDSYDYDDSDDLYYDDDGGNFFDAFGSPLCALSIFSLLEGIEDLPVVAPGVTVTDDFEFEFDFGADNEAVDAYISACAELGGQNIVIDADYSDGCDSSDFINWNQCVGSLCDQDDINFFGPSFADPPPTCTVSTEVRSLDGLSGDLGISASDVCIESMTEIFFSSDVYEDFDATILDEETGEFTGDLEALGIFSNECESTDGRVVLGTIAYDDECDEASFSSVPMCVAKSCDNEEASSFIELIYELVNPECVDVTVSITEIKSTKSAKKKKSKKAGKSGKGEKSSKAPKSEKGEKSSKAAKSGKEEKSVKATKGMKGHKSEKAEKSGKA